MSSDIEGFWKLPVVVSGICNGATISKLLQAKA